MQQLLSDLRYRRLPYSQRTLVRQRMRRGKSIDEALSNPYARPTTYPYEGKRVTLTQIEMLTGLSRKTIGDRLSIDLSVEEIVSGITPSTRAYKYGVAMVTAQELSAKSGINKIVIRTAIGRGEPIDEILLGYPKDPKLLLYKGKYYTVQELADYSGFSRSGLERRLRENPDPALAVETRKGKAVIYEYAGATYSLSELATLTRLPVNTLKYHIRSGKSVEAAIEYIRAKLQFKTPILHIGGVRLRLCVGNIKNYMILAHRELRIASELIRRTNMQTVTFKGLEWTIRELSLELGISIPTVRRRVSMSIPLDLPKGTHTLATKYEYEGQQYGGKALATKFKISFGTFKKELATGMNIEEIANKQRNNCRLLVTLKGRDYTFPELSELSGVSTPTLRSRIAAGVPVEVAIQKNRTNEVLYWYKNSYRSLGDLVNISGLSPSTIRGRLTAGMTVHKAIHKIPREHRNYELDGVRYTYKELLAMTTISQPTFFNRIRKGMSVREAIDPKHIFKGKKK